MPNATGAGAAALDEATLRALAGADAGDYRVVSLTLDCDGRRFPRKGDYEVRLLNTARDARSGLDRRALSPRIARQARADLDRAVRFVTTRFERGDARGLAVFSCDPIGLWLPLRLPKPVGTRIVLDRHAHVLRLEDLLSRGERLVTVLVGRDRARIFLTRLGETAEEEEVLDDVPGRHDQGGWSQSRYRRHIEQQEQAHFRRIGDALARLGREDPFEHLVLAGPDETLADFEKSLRAELAGRIAARLALPLGASIAEVRDAVAGVADTLEEERAAELSVRVREEAAAGRMGVAGVEQTLRALATSRADVLVLAPEEPAPPGWRCAGCGRLDLRDGQCPDCGSARAPVEDLLEEMVDEAIRRRCRVITGLPGAVPGGVGALLRY